MLKYYNEDFKEFLKRGISYDYVFIDPPWNYNDKSPKAVSQLSYSLWNNNTSDLLYILQNIKCDYIFLWTTNSMLQEVFLAINQQSIFVQKTMITWVKLTNRGNLFYGLGHNFRNSTEQLLVLVKKGAKPLKTNIRTHVQEEAGLRTLKPKKFEKALIDTLNTKKLSGCYIFSGLNCDSLDVDCVDIAK